MTKEQVKQKIKEIIAKDSRLKSETIKVVFRAKEHYIKSSNKE